LTLLPIACGGDRVERWQTVFGRIFRLC